MSVFSQLYQNQSNFFKQRVHKQTTLGLVAIIPFSEPVPPGWRILNIQQGRQIKKQLQSMISTWGIIAFSSGKLDGEGYGYKISNTYGNQCGQRFIIYSNCGAPSDPNQQSLSFFHNNQAAFGQMKCNNYVQNQKQYFQSELQNYEKVNTPIGLVIKVPLNLPTPQGFRVMSLGEGVEIKQFINEILNEWSIVAFQQGKIDGPGYGNKISLTYGQQCGQKFIISLDKQFSLN